MLLLISIGDSSLLKTHTELETVSRTTSIWSFVSQLSLEERQLDLYLYHPFSETRILALLHVIQTLL